MNRTEDGATQVQRVNASHRTRQQGTASAFTTTTGDPATIARRDGGHAGRRESASERRRLIAPVQRVTKAPEKGAAPSAAMDVARPTIRSDAGTDAMEDHVENGRDKIVNGIGAEGTHHHSRGTRVGEDDFLVDERPLSRSDQECGRTCVGHRPCPQL